MSSQPDRVPRAGAWRLRLLALVAVLLVTAGTRAQMLPFVPDPVTTPELMEYADLLGLSDEQRLPMLALHDAYRADFRALEDGDVRAFIGDLLRLVRVFTREGFVIPERAAFERLIEQFDDIIAKVNALDRRLFDRMSGSLTETQLARLPRVRFERELDVYAHLMDGPGELNPGAPVVLSPLVRELELDDEETARVAEPLRQYERAAVRRTRRVYRLLEEAAEFALDTLDRSGLREMTPLEMMQVGEDESFQADMRAAFDEGSTALQAELFAASQQNLRLLRQLTPLLTPDNGAALRDRYYRLAFGRVYGNRSPWRDSYGRALAAPSLTGARRQRVEEQRDVSRAREDQLIDRIVERVEASREYRTSEQLDREDGDELAARIATFREEREDLGGAALAALAALLTPEELAAIEGGAGDADGGAAPLADAGGGSGEGGRAGVEDDEDARDEEMRGVLRAAGVPVAMSATRRDQLARLAELDAEQRQVLDALHDNYREDYRAALAETMSNHGTGEDQDSEDEQRRRAARMATLAAMDEALFESIGLTLEGERVEAAVHVGRELRARERATAAARRSVFVFGREESYLDLVGVVLEMEQAPAVVAAVEPLVEEYALAVGPIVAQRLDAARDVRRRQRALSGVDDSGLGGKLMARTLEKKLEESRRAVRTLNRRIRDENRERLERMMDALDDGLAWSLRIAYMRTAFPDVYESERGLDEALTAVRALDDLTTRQGTQVEGIISDYRAEFSRLSERMVQFRRKRDFDFGAMGMPSQEAIEGEIQLERLRADRREARARVILRLRLVLTEAQIARSGLLELPDGTRRAFD